MKRILIVIDKVGWSYDTIAKGLVEHNRDPLLHMDIASAAEDAAHIERVHARYDLVFVLGWTSLMSKKRKDGFADLLPFLDRARVVTGIHSHRSWDEGASTPEHSPPPPAELIDKLGRLPGVNVISRRLWRIFHQAGLRNLTLTENGVDTQLFAPTRPIGTDPSAPLVVGFSGAVETAKHDQLKGFGDYIQPLGRLPQVRVQMLGGRGEGQVPRAQMPALYNSIDLYVCASSSEGFSQSVLEAAACGRPIVSTRVGGCEDLIEDGVNGHLVDRDVDAIAALIQRLQANRAQVATMGANSRHLVEQAYAWPVRVQEWLNFARSHL